MRTVAAVLVGVPAAYLVYHHGGSIVRAVFGLPEPGVNANQAQSNDDATDTQAVETQAESHLDGTDADVEVLPRLAGVPRELAAVVKEYLRYDPRPESVAAVEKLMSACKDAQCGALADAFVPRIAFGTAGLRSRMAHGYACMNELVVLQTSQGLCEYIAAKHGGRYDFSIVIGYDGRYNSEDFAYRTAAPFLLKGCKVFMFSKLVPTPYVAFAVKRLGCAAGVMVTASHNPKDDNGYKVYWGNGAQIISPHDKGIAAAILANLEPWNADSWNNAFVTSHPSLNDPIDDIHKTYLESIMGLPYRGKRPANPLPITYTAMHGVGYAYVVAAMEAAGFPKVIPVPEQVSPDPEFPTVEYPNPEEGKGALALAFAAAKSAGSSLILANDPDADRLAVAVKAGSEWRILSGNEVGALLGYWVWKAYKKTGAPASKACMLSSAVSSMILKTMAAKEGFYFEDTLTGFKWMGNRARELQAEGQTILLSFEEAIGFAIGGNVVDKDGVSAAVVLAGMANDCAAKNRTLIDELDEIHSKYGFHATFQSYFICRSQPTIDAIFSAIRTSNNGNYPKEVQKERIIRIRDLTTGHDSGEADGVAKLPRQSANMITFWFDSNIVLTLRTSGTEPKIKFYSEIIRENVQGGDAKETVKEALQATVQAVVNDLLQVERYSLQPKSA